MHGCSTACTPLEHEHVEQRTRVKCILDRHGHAIYFSRGMLPANKDGKVKSFPAPFQHQPYLLHLGLACFDRAFLAEYCRMAPTPLMVLFPWPDRHTLPDLRATVAGSKCRSRK